MSKNKNVDYCELEHAAKMLKIACSQDEFAKVNEDSLAKTLTTLSRMQQRVFYWNELHSNFSQLLNAFRQIDWIMHEGTVCFPVLPVGKLLGIQPPSPHIDFDAWIDDFVSNKKLDEFSNGDEVWLSEDVVLVLINDDSPFPVWVRHKLSNWFKRYCAEIHARSIFA